MASKWIGLIYKGYFGKGWGLRDETYRYNPEDKSCNAGKQGCDLGSHTQFSTEATKEECPSSL